MFYKSFISDSSKWSYYTETVPGRFWYLVFVSAYVLSEFLWIKIVTNGGGTAEVNG